MISKYIQQQPFGAKDELFKLLKPLVQQYATRILFSQDASWSSLSTLIAWYFANWYKQRKQTVPSKASPHVDAAKQMEQLDILTNHLLQVLKMQQSKL